MTQARRSAVLWCGLALALLATMVTPAGAETVDARPGAASAPTELALAGLLNARTVGYGGQVVVSRPWPPPRSRLDLNRDGLVDCLDLRIVADHLGEMGHVRSDINANGRTDSLDFATVAQNFTDPGPVDCSQ